MRISLRNRFFGGFTLIELMIVVAIIGILASVSIPIFSKYIKKSKTSEATLNLRKIYDGEVSYIQEESTDEGGGVVEKQFVTSPFTPSGIPGIDKRVGIWTDNSWTALKFAPDGPVQFSYQAIASGTGTGSAFSAYAYGDIDGDSETSLFLRTGHLDGAGNIVGAGGIYSIDETE